MFSAGSHAAAKQKVFPWSLNRSTAPIPQHLPLGSEAVDYLHMCTLAPHRTHSTPVGNRSVTLCYRGFAVLGNFWNVSSPWGANAN